MPRRDFVSSLLLIGLGLFVLIESIRMPPMTSGRHDIYAAPGLLPALLGVVLALFGLMLLIRAVRAGGWRTGAPAVFSPARWWSAGPRKLAFALALVVIYAVGMVGRVPFWLATFVFVVVFVSLFEWEPRQTKARHARRLGVACALAIAIAVGVTLLFERVFLIRLPG